MLSFDFNTYYDNKINIDENKKKELKDKLYNSNMTGWLDRIDDSLVKDIKETVKEIRSHSKCLVVIGIGGSFLGSKAVYEMTKSYFDDDFKIIYAGNNLSSKYLNELLGYLENVDFSINVISKSGTTMEPSIAYQYIKDLMIKKYDEEELRKRIIITTDPIKGTLREEVNNVGYKSFPIPENIGGRYSIMTAAHLLPLAFNIDIDKFIEGYYDGLDLFDNAMEYALLRVDLFNKGYSVESYTVYEENMYYFAEWIKQLYGETEGKDGKGLLPISTIQPRDLHSLGQFIQSGNKILFETFIKVKESDKLEYKSSDLHAVNNLVLDSVRTAHYKGDVPSIMIELDKLDEKNIGELMMFFMIGAGLSGYLFEVEPFDQPGVEIYKEEVRNNLKNL